MTPLQLGRGFIDFLRNYDSLLRTLTRLCRDLLQADAMAAAAAGLLSAESPQ
jgi:hypothetical protein